MSYQVLARKYRPQKFSDVIGQEHVTRTLQNAITQERIAHGYKIVILRKGNQLQDFMNGFLQNKTVVGRPCDIMKLSADSFLFTDDYSGIVYYVRKKK